MVKRRRRRIPLEEVVNRVNDADESDVEEVEEDRTELM